MELPESSPISERIQRGIRENRESSGRGSNKGKANINNEKGSSLKAPQSQREFREGSERIERVQGGGVTRGGQTSTTKREAL